MGTEASLHRALNWKSIEGLFGRMESNMQDIKIAMLIIFSIGAVFQLIGLLLSHRLFTSLKKRYTEYYKSVGSPIAFTPPLVTSFVIVQVIKSSLYLNSLVFRGVPKDFPKDVSLMRLAKILRIILGAVLALVVALIVLGYFFYKSTS